MPYFVINGKPDCPQFIHAGHVAKYLSERLPNFDYKQVQKLPNEWAVYISTLNKQNAWFITESPLIWKEINIWGGKKHLIGGLSEFWEYVYCYYGLESIIPKEDLKQLTADNLKFFLQHENTATELEKHVRVIGILGASAPQTFYLINSLLHVSDLEKKAGMRFQIHDSMNGFDKNNDILTYFNNLSTYGARNVISVAETEDEAIKDADILIHVEDFRKEIREKEQVWLKRCFISMRHIAGIINKRAKRNCIVIMNNHGPVCFLATCLVEMCTRLRPSNIVAVTADVGLSVLNVVSEVSHIPVDKLSAPPVWGFVGLNSFVDERNTVFFADIQRPYDRALTAPIGSTLPLGTMQSELRVLTNLMMDHDEITRKIYERHEKMNVRLNRAPILGKIRALTSLLQLWFASTDSDDIISLGVCSNGSFGITPGIVFSQPVKLDDKRKWVPYDKFPLMDESTKNYIEKCVCSASEALLSCGMEKNDNAPSVEDASIIASDSISTLYGYELENTTIFEDYTIDGDENIIEEENIEGDENVYEGEITGNNGETVEGAEMDQDKKNEGEEIEKYWEEGVDRKEEDSVRGESLKNEKFEIEKSDPEEHSGARETTVEIDEEEHKENGR